MAQRLALLGLPEDQLKALEGAEITTIQQLRDSQYADLKTAGLDRAIARDVFYTLEVWLEQRFRGEVLLPYLPDPCHYVECAYLDLRRDVLVSLEAHGFQYLYQLALSRRSALRAKIGEEALPLLSQALSAFLESYRQGEIELQIEEI